MEKNTGHHFLASLSKDIRDKWEVNFLARHTFENSLMDFSTFREEFLNEEYEDIRDFITQSFDFLYTQEDSFFWSYLSKGETDTEVTDYVRGYVEENKDKPDHFLERDIKDTLQEILMSEENLEKIDIDHLLQFQGQIHLYAQRLVKQARTQFLLETVNP